MHIVENGCEYINIFGLKFKKKIDLIKYWEERAEKYGERAVRNITRTVEQSKEEVNAKEKLYLSVLENAGISNVNVAIDFGCGVGSYENLLSQLAKEKVYGVDVTKKFLELAPDMPKVEYIHLENPIKIPLNDNIADFVFINSVLGGIVDDNILKSTLKELDRISSDNAIFFICEGFKKSSVSYWKGRRSAEYKYILNQVFANNDKGGNAFLNNYLMKHLL